MIVHPNFDPVALSIGPLSIHWYGLMYLFGFGAGLLLGQSRAKNSQSDWNPDEVIDFLFFIAMGVIIGGRLGYVVFYNLQFYLSHPLDIFALWDGGMSFHGGLIGITVTIALYARKTQREYMAVADFLVPLIPPGLFFGRIGNFINQELWGRATDLPWGVLFYTAPNQPRHPSQLYEALLEGLVLFIVIWIFSKSKRAAGQVTGLLLVLYGLFRFLIEFVREPDGHIGTIVFDWLTMGQLLSVPMIILGLYFVFRRRSNYP